MSFRRQRGFPLHSLHSFSVSFLRGRREATTRSLPDAEAAAVRRSASEEKPKQLTVRQATAATRGNKLDVRRKTRSRRTLRKGGWCRRQKKTCSASRAHSASYLGAQVRAGRRDRMKLSPLSWERGSGARLSSSSSSSSSLSLYALAKIDGSSSYFSSKKFSAPVPDADIAEAPFCFSSISHCSI